MLSVDQFRTYFDTKQFENTVDKFAKFMIA